MQQTDKINLNDVMLRYTVQRSAKGAICIDQCSPDGKYIQLANTSAAKDVDLSGWRLLQNVDNGPSISYIIPNNFQLNHRKTVKIYARDRNNERSPTDLISSSFDTWSVGLSVVTRLLNNDDDERAVHIQRTIK